MLLVTESAKGALKTKLDSVETQPGQCARIKVAPGGQFALSLDVETPEDHVVKHGETKILVVDSKTARRLEGLVLDFRDSGEGPELTLLRKEDLKQADT
jgi:Fe-S cluster assembly iron-binding protein IscA